MKVAILGFGIEGQDAARYFLKKKAEVTVFDKKTKKELVAKEWEKEPLEWVAGTNYLAKGLQGFDLIVRSPGFYRYHEKLVEAEKKGAKITSSTILFFEECRPPIIAVTGTKGKGTTARMIELALKEAGFKVVLGGNIGGPMFSLLPRANKADWVVLELSSFQTIDLERSPRIVVVTNITVDHLDWHKDKEEYVAAKGNLWKHQTGEDYVVFNRDDETSRQLSASALGQGLYFSINKTKVNPGAYADAQGRVHLVMGEDKVVGSAKDLAVPGKHNWANALAALTAAVLAGADAGEAWQGVLRYKGAEHRLEKVAEKNGVVWVNDSAATTPEATAAAIKAFSQPKILILGGSRKGREFGGLAKYVTTGNVKAVILIGETAGEIKKALKAADYKGEAKVLEGNMRKIVKKAEKLASRGDAVLLSPACASFGIFTNYKERGEKFKEAVGK